MSRPARSLSARATLPAPAKPAPGRPAAGIGSTRASKGELTRALILDHALRHAAVHGFEALTIGTLAEKSGLSKSGLFAHFGSKEDLQIAALDEAVRRYNQAAFLPALAAPRGLPRLKALFNGWLDWTERAELVSCPVMAASAECDRRDGPMRDAVEGHLRRLHLELAKSVEMVIAAGEFDPDTDPDQFAFELFGIFSSFFRSRNLFRDARAAARARTAFARLVESALARSSPPGRAATAVRRAPPRSSR